MFHSIRTRIVAAFVIVMVIITAVASVGTFQYIHQYESNLSDTMGTTAAESCATVLEVMADDGVDLNPDGEEYGYYRNVLRGLCKDAGMEYMYAYHCNPEDGTITYVICVAADDAEDRRVARERSYGTVVHTELDEQELRTLAGERVPEALLLDNEFGTTLAWFEKVDGWGGDVIAGADYSLTKQRARIYRLSLTIIVPFVLTLLILMLVQMFLLRKYVFDPIHSISERMKAFSSKHTVDVEPLGIDSRDEIGEIANSFEGMATDIGVYIQDIERMTTERVQADVEMDVARRIQQGMVPEHMEGSRDGFDAYAMSHPARSVGGDFYDAVELDDGRIAVFVGDVSGKGVGAALYMSLAQTVIGDCLLAGQGPAEALNTVNARLCDSNPESMFITVLACVFDPKSGLVRLANAGHMPPVIIGQEAREFAVEPGILLGLFDDSDIKETSFTLQPNESMLLYTDGVTEAVNAEGKFFEMSGLLRCLESEAPFTASQTVVETVVKSVESFVDGSEQFDDLTLLALHRSADAHNADVREALSVDMDSFDVVRDQIMESAPDRAFGLRACLACEEAFANIVLYSGATAIWVSVAPEGEGLCVILEDDGIPFDPFANEAKDKQFEDLDEGGMGIGIIRDSTREATYRREADHNVLVLLF